MVKPNTTTRMEATMGAGGILREQDEADEYRDGQDEAAQDGLRGLLIFVAMKPTMGRR